MTRKDKSTETDNIAWGWEWEEWLIRNGQNEYFWGGRHVLKLDCSDGCTTLISAYYSHLGT